MGSNGKPSIRLVFNTQEERERYKTAARRCAAMRGTTISKAITEILEEEIARASHRGMDDTGAENQLCPAIRMYLHNIAIKSSSLSPQVDEAL